MAVSSPPHVVILEESPVLATAFGRVFADADDRVTALADRAITPAEVLALLPNLVVVDLQCGYGRRGLDLVWSPRETNWGGQAHHRVADAVVVQSARVHGRRARAPDRRAARPVYD
jgi:hypothetical protein